MLVNGCDCSIVIKTAYREFGVAYAEETLREAVSLLQEEAAIEGDGGCKAIAVSRGVTGCVITPLSIGSAPLLLSLAFGSASLPVFVSETRNVYLHKLFLYPMENSTRFDLIQDRGNERRLFERCLICGFELRINRNEPIKLKFDVCGENSPAVYSFPDRPEIEDGERFNGDFVSYRINGKAHDNIYGLTLSALKEGGTRTEVFIKRAVENPRPCGFSTSSFASQNSGNLSQPPSVAASDLPGVIDELEITAQLRRDTYEARHYGAFRVTVKRLVLVADETDVNCADCVVGPLRYYVAGTVQTDVLTSGTESLA